MLDREEKRREQLQQANVALEQQLAEVRKRTINMRMQYEEEIQH